MSEKKIMVSICMITYNHEAYISKAIEGVLNQKTSFSIELIIGEDCSTDNTRRICQSYQTKYPDKIKLLLPETNLGMIRNFVDTFYASQGEFIAICEGDDYWIDPLKLQKQVDFMLDNEDYGLVYGKAQCYNIGKKEFGNVIGCSIPSIYSLLFDKNNIPTLSVCIRKKILTSFFMDKDILNYEWKMLDYPLWIYLFVKSKIKFYDEVFGIYQILPESASHSVSSIIKRKQFLISEYKIREYFILNYFKNKKYLRKNRECFLMSLYSLNLEYGINDFSEFKNELVDVKMNSLKIAIVRVAIVFPFLNIILRYYLNYRDR